MKVPSLLIHRPTARYYCYLPDRRRLYFGKWGGEKKPPLSIVIKHQNYVRTLLDPASPPIPQTVAVGAALTMVELGCLWEDHCRVVYPDHDDSRRASWVVPYMVGLYPRTPARQFLGLKFQSVWDQAGKTLTRQGVNLIRSLVLQVFRWAVARDLVPVEVLKTLECVKCLEFGRTHVRESLPVREVPESVVMETLPLLPEMIGDMVRLFLLTGCRGKELFLMRHSEVELLPNGQGVFRPSKHKNLWKKKFRQIPIGPIAMAVLTKYLDPLKGEDIVFSPRDRLASHYAARSAGRQSPRQPSQAEGVRRKGGPLARPPGEFWESCSFARVIVRAIGRHNKENPDTLIPVWSRRQLRKTCSQKIRDMFGLEEARAILGHASQETTADHYAREDLKKALDVAGKVG